MIISRHAHTRYFIALNRSWQLIKTLKTKLWLRRLTQVTVGTWWIDIFHLARVSFCKFINVQGSHYWRILFVVNRIFFGRLRPEDIQYWKLLEVETVEISACSFDCISDNIFRYHFPFCSFNQHCEQCKGFFERKIER